MTTIDVVTGVSPNIYVQQVLLAYELIAPNGTSRC